MKGVILAGGTGSRLYPLTKVTNKHLLPVGRYPMVYHPLAKLKQAGINKVLIVTGKEHMGAVVSLLGSGAELGFEFTYKVQDHPGGIAQALGLAKDFAHGEPLVAILGDNIFADDLTPYVQNYLSQGLGGKILLKEVADPARFGVAEIREGRVLSIEEKPEEPKSSFCVTGIYLYDSQVFEFIRRLQLSARGELEITDVNNLYIQQSRLTYDILKGFWSDVGTFSSLLKANELTRDTSYDILKFGRVFDD